MAQLIVRNLEEDVVEALKIRAARNGRSAEAEHREILRQALVRRTATPLKAHLMNMPNVGTDDDFVSARQTARRVDI
jgi:plasmid stability protein